jgi:hypothetical protein
MVLRALVLLVARVVVAGITVPALLVEEAAVVVVVVVALPLPLQDPLVVVYQARHLPYAS